MLGLSYSLHGHDIIYYIVFATVMIGSPFDVKLIISH